MPTIRLRRLCIALPISSQCPLLPPSSSSHSPLLPLSHTRPITATTNQPPPPPLFESNSASVYRYGPSTTSPIFTNLSFKIESRKPWAVLGKVASGKTSLGKCIAGTHRFEPTDSVRWPFLMSPPPPPPASTSKAQKGWKGVTDAVRMVSFGGGHNPYAAWGSMGNLQERYHASMGGGSEGEEEDGQTVVEYLTGLERERMRVWKPEGVVVLGRTEEGFERRETLKEWMGRVAVERYGKVVERWGCRQMGNGLGWEEVSSTFQLDSLLNLSMLRLSNGQMRRVRLAKALLFPSDFDDEWDFNNPQEQQPRPQLLILDEPFMGLDVQTRQDISNLLGLVSKDERFPDLMLLLRPQDGVPEWVENVLELDSCKVVFQGTREAYQRRLQQQQQQQKLDSPNESSRRRMQRKEKGVSVVSMKDVNVYGQDGTKILDSINWDIHAGESWALLGPNGSGKTTLLSLITADHPQSYSNTLHLFSRPRGSGESIWELKSQIGFVSPELHLLFASSRYVKGGIAGEGEGMSVLEALQTGWWAKSFFEGVERKEEVGRRGAVEMLKEFGFEEEKMGKEFKKLSMGEQRVVLILRALVTKPKLIIMDEPFQGLDSDMVSKLKRTLADNLEPHQSLILVTHHDEEIPDFVDRRLKLNCGKVVDVV
ncbi:hypothetical protein HDV05_008138 [Chytridiales sp. JEL 0842]|nr:hypothetical protein HDV05_008138 [Chytridiales sp. JEL 0842]